MPTRLSAAKLKPLRDAATTCALCGERFTTANPPVVDHCHKTGHIRGVLHRGCNAMLGVIENGRPRYQLLNDKRLHVLLSKIVPYLIKNYSDNDIYPTFRTDDEKRLLKNKRARAARAAKKEV